MADLLEINDLHATIDETIILKGVNLKIKPGEVHVIMGPNGSGKSTLSKVLAGHPAYTVIKGNVSFKEENLLDLDPTERAHKGLFLAFQYPVEVPGVSNEDFLRLALNAKRKANGEKEIDPLEFLGVLSKKLDLVNMNPNFLSRNVNEGFSGGEKKRNEILQFAVLDSQLGVLDETDSGLDIDALKSISNSINILMKDNPERSLLLVTHYNRLLEYIKPDFVHVMSNGKIIKTGTSDLAKELEAKGYEWVIE